MRTLDHVEDRVTVWGLIAKAHLSVRELKVLLWRFGFLGDNLTQREVAAEIGRSTGRAAQIEWRALQKLRRVADPVLAAEVLRERVDRATHRGWWVPAAEPPTPVHFADKTGAMAAGEMAINCDNCHRRLVSTIMHRGGQVPSDQQERLWNIARACGWTIIPGRDLCPMCSESGPVRTALASDPLAGRIDNRERRTIGAVSAIQ